MCLTHIQQLHGYVIQTFFHLMCFIVNGHQITTFLCQRGRMDRLRKTDVRVLLCNLISRLWLTGSVALH